VSAGLSNLALRKRRWLRLLAFPLLVVPCLIAANRAGVWVAEYVSDNHEYVSDNHTEQLAPDLVIVVPAKVEFGIVRAGQVLESPIAVTNRGGSTVRLDALVTSCSCSEVTLAQTSIGPGETVPGVVRLDLKQEPDFIGDLDVTVQGRDEGGQAILKFSVEVTVRK
jgi:Protein of unknown function (DUF1573)